MACSFNTHHTASWSLVLLALLLVAILPHRRSHAILTNSSRSGGGGRPSNSSLLVPARCLTEQAESLLQLKRSFWEEEGSTTLSSWREGTDCCSWEGVECDHVAGNVTGLDLSFRWLGISGGLHPALFNLTSLKHLNLDYNQFCGSHLPSSGFERLTHLEDLSIAGCDLSGPIPPSFSGLHSLKTISLGYNNFSGSTFPLCITHLRQLKVLDFRSMSLSGPIPSSIGNLSSLTELNLSGNEFSWVLPSALSNLTYLSKLECSSCGLSGRVPSLGNLSQLEFIDLSQNNLEGPIPLGDGNILPNLQQVYLSRNSFTGTIQASIFTQPALLYLDLSSNYLSGHIEEFQNPSATLTDIYLFNNNLSGTVSTSFSQLRALTVLSLDSNNLMGTLDLYPYLMLRNFTSFSASYNPLLSVSGDDRDASTDNSSIIDALDLSSCGLTRLPSVIKYLPKLAYLDLSNNSIRGNIPDWIWRNMSFLSLQHNLFTNVGQLPAYTTIYVMDLSFNKLGGPVPFPFEGKDLDYSNNKFSSIPPLDFRRQFGVTRSIILANNELSGPIPYAECHQDDVLQVLDLPGNNLSGSVPPYLLKGCGNGLAVLNLRGNHLNGSWPDEMGETCSLEVIDLHGNEIKGRLPRSLANCKSLKHLDVGRNRFVDVFPSWLGSIPYLWLLVLRSNKFYGPLSIPVGKNYSVATSYFSGLQIIDLAGNGFNGVLQRELFNCFKSMFWPTPMKDPRELDNSGDPHIPDLEHYSTPVEVSMKQLYLSMIIVPKDLGIIDLSNNRFSGSIPNTIGNLSALHVLNMSHNALSGNIPDELGRLSKVESLDLSWNRLTGSIPQALASVTSLEVLNLSYNDLSGSIPSGTQFSTFPPSSFQGGNQGLYGCPLPIRCNLTRPSSGSRAPSPRGGAPAADHKFETVILCLFVGSGYGVGVAVAVVLQMACCGRRMKKALEKIRSCLVRR